MQCVCKHCWMNSITQIIHKASTLSAFKTSCCQSTLPWKCRIFMAKVNVMFHYERALPQTNPFVNNQKTLSLQAQANEVWELMHHNGILVALQQCQNRKYGDSKPNYLQRLPCSKRALLKEGVVKIASAFKVLHSCDAGMACQKVLRNRSFFKGNVFMSQSSRCGSHKFVAFKTTSQSLRCIDWFA